MRRTSLVRASLFLALPCAALNPRASRRTTAFVSHRAAQDARGAACLDQIRVAQWRRARPGGGLGGRASATPTFLVRTPATASTIYSICSISKLFTSVALCSRRERRTFRLDDPVAKHFRDDDQAFRAPESGEITIEGLLHACVGSATRVGSSVLDGARFPVSHSRADHASALPRTDAFQRRPYHSTRLGITLAGEVAARGQGSLPDLIARNILSPLVMTSTTSRFLPSSGADASPWAIARSYAMGSQASTVLQTRALHQRPASRRPRGHVEIRELQLRLLGKGGTEILNVNTLRDMQRVHWVDPDSRDAVGTRFPVWRSDNKTFVGHGGSCPGFRTQLLLKPDEKIATIFMANALGVNSGMWASAHTTSWLHSARSR